LSVQSGAPLGIKKPSSIPLFWLLNWDFILSFKKVNPPPTKVSSLQQKARNATQHNKDMILTTSMMPDALCLATSFHGNRTTKLQCVDGLWHRLKEGVTHRGALSWRHGVPKGDFGKKLSSYGMDTHLISCILFS